jgi:apolipoprotein N-acyltransferase
MKLNAWTWLISGIIVSAISGYVYLTIPKNGQPNIAMALFFFIGIVFIVVGVVQLFFKRADDQSIMNSLNTAEQPQPKIVTMPNNLQNLESKPNRVDETIAQMMQQEQQPKIKTQIPITPTNTAPNIPIIQHNQKSTNHTNSFSKIHEYKGPVHTASTGKHAEHPVTQHTPTPAGTAHQTNTNAVPQHRIQNTTEHSIKCRKCGNANTGSSNNCHQCGNRLK